MKNEIAALITDIIASYNNQNTGVLPDWTTDTIRAKFSPKYIKITEWRDGRETRVWGFVCVADNPAKGLLAGDILKPASFKAPVLNHARGNVFHGYKICWTGPAYCGSDAQADNELLAVQAKFETDVVDKLVEA